MNSLRRRLGRRATTVLASLFILGLVCLSALSIGTYGAVKYTARSEFCDSCHIMDPYFASWERSSHKDVDCVACHYEPGTLETLGGKFQALSQLAKYVTRTQGTKPWAEVSDSSCLRSGCHSVPALEGRLDFDGIAFDHRQHLLESRGGRRLRCVTCHSQVVQDQHFAVEPSVCITCHFMPDEHGQRTEVADECRTCHGAPSGLIDVAGRPFDHGEYLERGVACRECHDPVVEGQGTVRDQRCRSCHGEPELIGRRGDAAYLHEVHVSEHKVECFECHDEMHHGLLPTSRGESAREAACGSCHVSAHEAVRSLYAGTGAHGVADDPSRMYQTRVACQACHTGRSSTPAPPEATFGPHLEAAHPRVPSGLASAGNVDCIHCHGTGFDGMLGNWQRVVSGELERLQDMLAELPKQQGGQIDESRDRLLREARQNLELVAVDGSRGAHNVSYALAALRAAAERIDRLREGAVDDSVPKALAGAPFVSKDGCSACHLGQESADAPAASGARFPHAAHVAAAGLECSACHSASDHGKPAPGRVDCATCHHGEASGRDPSNCASCHDAQANLLAGEVLGFPESPGEKADMDCSDCHGEGADIGSPAPALCNACHEADLQQELPELAAQLEALQERVRQALAQRSSDDENAQAARRALRAVADDGSKGCHNYAFAKAILERSLELLQAK